jgi:alpha-D-xyloside xylohydrolase
MAVLRASAVLHYELAPYFEALLARHQPVLAPLAYAFPGDPHAWASPLELLVGPDLLAAPVTGPGQTPSVYLPPGSWVDLYSGRSVEGGGASFTRPTPDSQFPLYVRAGAVLPFNLRLAGASWWGLNALSRPGYRGYLATNAALLDLHGLPAHVQIFVPAGRRPARVTLGGRGVGWRWSSGPLPGVVVRLAGPTVQGRILVSGS